MKRISFIVLVMFMLLLSCNNMVAGRKIQVPTKVLQTKVEEIFPLSKSTIIGTATVSNPVVTLRDDKVVMGMNYKVVLLGGTQEGSFVLSSKVKYDPETYEVYLVDFFVDELKNKDGVRIDDNKTADVIKELLSNYIATKPVYTFEEEDTKVLRTTIRSVLIENSKLYVHF